MAISVAVPKETAEGERRVALVPESVSRLIKTGYEVLVGAGAGEGAFYPDDSYKSAGAEIVEDVKSLFGRADVILKVQPPSSEEIDLMKESSIVIGFMSPYSNLELVARMRDKGITSFSLELVPRITRAQSMDALSSQSTVTGYKAALMAADKIGRFLPMLTTAAGTIRPAKVLVLGAGVAGLQAIATAHRLGALVEAYDVRQAAKEQVESVGGRFLMLDVDAEAEGGYARELTEEEKQREKEMLEKHITEADIIITTAIVPGQPAPRLITADMVRKMKEGSVIVDLAAETGGNCELTEEGKEVEEGGVKILGPSNVPSMLPVHASEMYSKNLYNLLILITKNGETLEPDWEDEIVAKSVLTHKGEIRDDTTRKMVEGDVG